MISPLEIRIILYAVLTLGIIGGTAWGVHTLDANHYERIAQADKLAQDEALQESQRNVIAAQKERDALKDQVEKDRATMAKADAASRDAVLGSVRSLESALHLGGLSGAMDHSAQSGGSTTGAGSDPELERAVAGVNSAVEKAISACQHDSGNYANILKLAPH